MPTTAYIALGANLGDRARSIQTAIDLLNQTPGLRVTRLSPLLENPAIGGPADSPPFLNAAAAIQTSLTPHEVMSRLLEIESTLGRQRTARWDPRTIDLDLLLYGDQVIDSPGLTLPHPRMHERDFVLVPLSQIAPDVIHPITRQTILQMLEKLRTGESIR